jgi:hypothetical protein
MTNASASRWRSAAWRLRLAVHDHWRIALAFAVAAVVIIAIGLWKYEDPSQVVEEQAEILRFGSHDSKSGNHPIVFIRLRDGIVRQVPVSRDIMRQCRSGSPIRILRGRNTFRISPMGCAPFTP